MVFFSWLALGLVITQLWLMGSNHYKAGWWFAIAACFAWAVYAIATGGWALLGQQFVIGALGVRALRNLPRWSKQPEIDPKK